MAGLETSFSMQRGGFRPWTLKQTTQNYSCRLWRKLQRATGNR